MARPGARERIFQMPTGRISAVPYFPREREPIHASALRLYFCGAVFLLMLAACLPPVYSYAAAVSPDRITGNIHDAALLTDGRLDTGTTIGKSPRAPSPEIIVYLPAEMRFSRVTVDIEGDPSAVLLSVSSDIVSWRPLNVTNESSRKDSITHIVVTPVVPEAGRYVKIAFMKEGVSEFRVMEIAIEDMPRNPTPNEVMDLAVDSSAIDAATVTYRTKYPVESNIRYSASKPVFDKVQIARGATTEHTIALKGLDEGTVYFYQIIYGDNDTNAVTEVKYFRTAGDPAPFINKIDMPPPRFDEVTLVMDANKPLSWEIIWGQFDGKLRVDASKIPGAQSTKSDTVMQHIEFTLKGLTPRTRYFFQAVSSDDRGRTFVTDMLGFDTPPLNLAKGKSVTGTFVLEMQDEHIRQAPLPMARVTDEDINYHTGIAKSSPTKTADQWVQVDLGEISPVKDIVVTWSALAVPEKYTVSISEDGAGWIEVQPSGAALEKTSPKGEAIAETSFVADGKARYVKLFIPKGTPVNSRFGWRHAMLAELWVFAP